MIYTVTIETENAAFHETDGSEQLETARILRRLASDVESMGLCDYSLRDVSGNQVGSAYEG